MMAAGIAVVLIAGCGPSKHVGPPPRATDTIPAESQSSTIAVPPYLITRIEPTSSELILI